MADFSEEDKKEIHMFMGSINSTIKNIGKAFADVRNDHKMLEDKVSNIEKDFSGLKGKLTAVAAFITLAINGAWHWVKGGD